MKRKSLLAFSANAGPSEKRSKEQAVTRATSLGLTGKALSSGLPGTSLKLPLEVGLQLMVSRPPACDHVVELLDWFCDVTHNEQPGMLWFR
ncbi:hypothetical protein DPEC_G00038730 [Dallia pectoralis]|uniref:Uncharacterized protein n=1 Tax=Dallia pectoralis TaxID=75939 RepID=A0ACC2HE73_DALPE|nr:hypothetical protein DPEC_G00038730 [Dallia pectoralis]